MAERDLSSELRHRRQNRRAATTILIVLLMLFFAFWYAYSYYRASGGASDASPRTSATCRPFNPNAPTPANTTVNVYNASDKTGLAARTAASLRQRGFTVGKVSNDPLGRSVSVVEVRYGQAGKSRAPLVVALGGKGTTSMTDKRQDASLDLVLGSKFTTLAPAPKPTGLPMCPAPRPSASPS